MQGAATRSRTTPSSPTGPRSTRCEHQIDENDEPMLVNLVTMQNHLPMADCYTTRSGSRATWIEETDPRSAASRAGWSTPTPRSDEFLEASSASDEETVVVFYGDHYPGIFGKSLLDQNPGVSQLETPLLIWSSRGQEPRAAADDEREPLPSVRLRSRGRDAAALLRALTRSPCRSAPSPPARSSRRTGRELHRDEFTAEQERATPRLRAGAVRLLDRTSGTPSTRCGTRSAEVPGDDDGGAPAHRDTGRVRRSGPDDAGCSGGAPAHDPADARRPAPRNLGPRVHGGPRDDRCMVQAQTGGGAVRSVRQTSRRATRLARPAASCGASPADSGSAWG